MNFIPVILLFLPVFIALLIFLIPWRSILSLGFINQIVLIILTFYLWQEIRLTQESVYLVFGPYNERFVISFFVDETSILFIGLTVIMFSIVMLYAYPSMKNESKFYFFLLFLEAVFIGLLSTNDLFNLFVFLELTTLLVTILIVYKKNESAFKAGLHYLLISSLAAMLFLLGTMFIYYAFGTLNIQIIMAEMTPSMVAEPSIQLAYILMMSGIFVKAAFFPVYSWLPKAHGVATSSVSALLSGLIVKGAIYLIIRLHLQMFHAPYDFSEVIFWLGVLSALAGALFAMSQKDIKQVLAFHTISQVGLIVMGLMTNDDTSYVGGLLHVFNHAFFKGLLFLVAGVIIEHYQTKKINDIRGLWKTMPWVSILLIVGILGITGAPLFNGFVSKSLIKYAFKEDGFKMIFFHLINIFTLISFTKLLWMLPGKKIKTNHTSHFQSLAMNVLAILVVFMGIAYPFIGQSFFDNPWSNVQLTEGQVWIDFLIYAMWGLISYLFIVKPDFSFFQWLRSRQPKFNTAIFLLLILISFVGVIVVFT
jgi:multicomponent Na+:H+ antiporter subunit D